MFLQTNYFFPIFSPSVPDRHQMFFGCLHLALKATVSWSNPIYVRTVVSENNIAFEKRIENLTACNAPNVRSGEKHYFSQQ